MPSSLIAFMGPTITIVTYLTPFFFTWNPCICLECGFVKSNPFDNIMDMFHGNLWYVDWMFIVLSNVMKLFVIKWNWDM